MTRDPLSQEERVRPRSEERLRPRPAGRAREVPAEGLRYLRAEWTKLRTAPETVWLVIGIVAATVGVGLVVALNMPCTTAVCGGDPTKAGLTGVQLGQAVVAVLAVLAIGGEYGTGMIHGTLAAMPRRTGILAAKAVVVTAAVAPAAVVAVTVAALAGRHILPAGVPTSTVVRAAGGSVVYLVLIGLLAVGVAAVVRNAAAAVGVVLALLFLFPVLAAAAPDPTWERHLLQAGPMTAGLAVQATTGLDKLPIGPWAGLGVTAAWAAAALLAAAIALEARDA
ncbi:ABC transporter permease [Dactylosporangium sp. NPDC005555]|uniref:ABC transporter permease n=1 Tax=Dactylosporangium sp. NPDC005555 TaxID=3154889 RepID=UPI0033AD6B37